MIASRVKKALDYLQAAYYNNMIVYPRVDNNFITSKQFNLFPHPVMRRLNESMLPLKKKKFVLTKDTSLLFLSSVRLLQPSTLQAFSNFIDDFFDDALEFLSNKKKLQAEEAIRQMDVFLKEHEIKEEELLEMENSIYHEREKSENEYFVFKIESAFFVSENRSKKRWLQSFLEWAHNKKTTISENLQRRNNLSSKIPSFDDLRSGVKHYIGLFTKKHADDNQIKTKRGL
jgi:AAA15 family ATPase/GTPase